MSRTGWCYRGLVMRGRFKLLLLGLVVAAITGCGYHLIGTASTLPEGVSTLYLERFQNQTRFKADPRSVISKRKSDTVLRTMTDMTTRSEIRASRKRFICQTL